MLKADKLKKAAASFLANPKDSEYHVTDDGQCFREEHGAANHARNLQVKKIEVIKRGEVTDLIEALKTLKGKGA